MHCVSFFSRLAEYSIFAEVGERRYHGNFGWGLQLVAFLTYFVCIKNFYMSNFDYNYDNGWEQGKILAGWIILFLQFSFGIYYIVHLLTTADNFFRSNWVC